MGHACVRGWFACLAYSSAMTWSGTMSESCLQYAFDSVKLFATGATQNDDVTAMVVNYESNSADG